jgi:hypothetical protein
LLVAKFGTLEAVAGMFAVLTGFRVFGWALLDILSRVFQPYITMLGAQGRDEQLRFYAGLSTKLTAALAAAICLAAWLLAEPAVNLWLGADVFPGYAVLALLGAAFLVDGLFLPTTNILVALNRHRALALVMTTKALLTVLLGALGAMAAPADPAIGIAAGFLAASVLGELPTYPWLARRALGLSPSAYLRRFLLQPACPPVAALLLMPLGPALRAEPPGVQLLVTALAILLLVPLIWYLVLARDERLWLVRLATIWLRRPLPCGP